MSHSTTCARLPVLVGSVRSGSAVLIISCRFGAPKFAPASNLVTCVSYMENWGSPMYSMIFQYRSRGELGFPYTYPNYSQSDSSHEQHSSRLMESQSVRDLHILSTFDCQDLTCYFSIRNSARGA